MNILDIDWMKKVKEKNEANFKKATVLELGSRDVNGNSWKLFEECNMTGIDWIAGVNVTYVMRCDETKFDKDTFDTIISLNHLEHDPYWEKSLSNNFPFLKKDGLLALRWADIKSSGHSLDSDPSGQHEYHPKALETVENFVKENGFEILEAGRQLNPSIGIMAFVVARKK